uniref:Bm11016 n=1 Tax=Brugia malayi TaxID=6279 RepID=A0A0H5SCE8_BRUMA|nr:Bm11016 [Brugia malayi]
MTEEHSRGPMDTSTLDAENVSAWENHKLESELAILGDKESVLVKDHPPDLVSSYIETILKTVMVFEVITGAPNLTRVYNNLAGKFMDEVANFTGHQALVNLQFDHKSQMSRILILSEYNRKLSFAIYAMK